MAGLFANRISVTPNPAAQAVPVIFFTSAAADSDESNSTLPLAMKVATASKKGDVPAHHGIFPIMHFSSRRAATAPLSLRQTT
jgi:hypothetical protein